MAVVAVEHELFHGAEAIHDQVVREQVFITGCIVDVPFVKLGRCQACQITDRFLVHFGPLSLSGDFPSAFMRRDTVDCVPHDITMSR